MISVHCLHTVAIFVLWLFGEESLQQAQAVFCPTASFLPAGLSSSLPFFACCCWRHSRLQLRSQKVISLPNEKGCWAVVSASAGGERSRHLLGGAGIGGKATHYLLYLSCVQSQSAPKPRPQRLNYRQDTGMPHQEVKDKPAEAGSRFHFLYIQLLVNNRLHMHFNPERKRYIVYSFQKQHCGEPTAWCLILLLVIILGITALWVVPTDPLSRSFAVWTDGGFSFGDGHPAPFLQQWATSEWKQRRAETWVSWAGLRLFSNFCQWAPRASAWGPVYHLLFRGCPGWGGVGGSICS